MQQLMDRFPSKSITELKRKLDGNNGDVERTIDALLALEKNKVNDDPEAEQQEQRSKRHRSNQLLPV